jgi:pimeloyl-ACP methyl ester carboxylesterase
MWRWSRRVVFVLLAAAIAGAAWQQLTSSRELEAHPPPGTLFDVGDHRLHLWCEGQGQPTVLLEASGLGTVRSYAKVLERLRGRVRVCAYDRAGMGWSEPSSRALSTGELAADLEHLVTAAKLEPPFVVAAASIGGLTAELFTRRHPEQVRALVMVDAVDSGALPEVGPALSSLEWRTCLAAPAAGVGLLRLMDPLHLSGEGAALTYRPAPFYSACSVLRGAAAQRSRAGASAAAADRAAAGRAPALRAARVSGARQRGGRARLRADVAEGAGGARRALDEWPSGGGAEQRPSHRR